MREDLAVGSSVWPHVNYVDEDVGDVMTFEMRRATGTPEDNIDDTPMFFLNATTGQLVLRAPLNYELHTTFKISFVVRDAVR